MSFGALDDVDQLATEVRDRLDPPPVPPTGDERAGDDAAFRASGEVVAPVDPACEASLAGGGTVVLRGVVDLAGRPANVVVFEHPGGRTLVVVGAGCSVLAQAPLDPGP
ncbi:MAG: hypothetical protein KatS3mg010_1358 [Acidimicrobiia bacterium]|nr:MAG: hypothetical protein KatS3mg010_1358 [Acidimicrobiia bacterium]